MYIGAQCISVPLAGETFGSLRDGIIFWSAEHSFFKRREREHFWVMHRLRGLSRIGMAYVVVAGSIASPSLLKLDHQSVGIKTKRSRARERGEGNLISAPSIDAIAEASFVPRFRLPSASSVTVEIVRVKTRLSQRSWLGARFLIHLHKDKVILPIVTVLPKGIKSAVQTSFGFWGRHFRNTCLSVTIWNRGP